MSDKKNLTEDAIGVVLVEKTPMEYKELVEKVEEFHSLNAHKVYTKFSVKLVKDDKAGMALIFVGEREESNEETAIRTAKEEATKKRVSDAELKEYLRLNKIYGKKVEV